ncbi:PD-(D/E)XK nuclease family protein [Riemerella anatipestifer]|uniref:PD-(D/E)XK nuclease family protein n=1 Tax=Riemerella anatipestifer TaxID=34085 RepID=A0AAP3EVQ8_RIEAN|nr:PD-(D/E)XK nuclease family protein [Riemerella anatipestifer]AZZ57888.1 PD-(D/E)XK nuclease family protein [Riemerella anatipestifer]MBT0551940.1 PD-(D/E)XK nuclease family protein [Riemerella anatipestifer]MBT0554125.1 PD-(D/E)XK nuclease family protein [Riemerella anatipestifer]MBT0572013.1 PD-(D/E)XK nuclease family protein [Riemerella anatipestifer]MCE3024726.1 PD-(D/E)XK nuclease family protein [Riemerella anatipestifer]
MNFLNKIVDELLEQSSDLSRFNIVLPGKRPVVFIKDILKNQKKYSGLLPQFSTIEELIKDISSYQEIKGISLWLFAYNVYRQLFSAEDFGQFLKWFPTLLKDWDDILKFSDSDEAVLEYMFDEERIKNWGETLGEEDNARQRNLNFWQKMTTFLPLLKKELKVKQWATSGMLHQEAKSKVKLFAEQTSEQYVFCGFNAFTPVEELLVRQLLQWDKAQCFFQADEYYIKDKRQEAGQFLRRYIDWAEFNDYRNFSWVENQFSQPKNINVYEVSGNVTQTQVIPKIFKDYKESDYSKTALVLLDENLLPACLEVLSEVPKVNITMGLPLKNLSFSNAMKQIFYLHKQLEKKSSTYYHHDVVGILETLPTDVQEDKIIRAFVNYISEHNIVYVSYSLLKEYLGGLNFFNIFEKKGVKELLEILIDFCYQLKYKPIDDIQYENISYFEKSFKIVKNQLEPYQFEVSIEDLEVLVNQMVSAESVDFQGEPLSGLQVMGLLETRLLNFENIILLSTNEGKLPLGNSQNTYLPFDVRKNFGLNTFLENDGIYAYHFYRLLQDAHHIHLLYNALSSGVNTGEKSRFITQIEMESPHQVQKIMVENESQPVEVLPMVVSKTPQVMERLKEWQHNIAASHLTTYLYNPIDFYAKVVLKIKETSEIEEELSLRNYGNLVHYALEFLYGKLKGKILTPQDLEWAITQIDESVEFAIKTLKHQPEFYERGMNFVHQQMAKKVIGDVLKLDLELVSSGNTLEILDLEKEIKDVKFKVSDELEVAFKGFIDRIDRLNGNLRVIDYKTAKTKNLRLKISDKNRETLLKNKDYKQALQLCIYAYAMGQLSEFLGKDISCGIWSFAEVSRGVQMLEIDGDLSDAMASISSIITEILNPDIDFEESV